MGFKDSLYRVRKEKGMSQKELVALRDVSWQAIFRRENGTADPDVESLKTLSRSLQVNIDRLLGSKIPLEKEVVKEKEVIHVHNHHTYERRYCSKLSIYGTPLMDINVGERRAEEDYWWIAKGITAIGNAPAGVISIGFSSVELCSLGLLTLGLLFVIGPLTLSYFAIGCLTIGYISIGVIVIGIYSIGAISIGFKFAIGVLTYGRIAMGTNPVGDIVYHLHSSNTCFLGS